MNWMNLFNSHFSEPSIRGILTACASISATLGLLVVHVLNTQMGWRTVGLACLSVPLITMLAVCFVCWLFIFEFCSLLPMTNANVTHLKLLSIDPGDTIMVVIERSR